MRTFEKILYHGTSPSNIQSIKRYGLRPTYLGKQIICMAPTREIAQNFGDLVLEVNVEGYDITCFEDCIEWERFVWTRKNIPVSKIKFIS